MFESLEHRALLAVDATLSLGTPSFADDEVAFPIAIEFSADAGERLAYFALDVEPSSANLVGSDRDYGAFAFDKATPLLDAWRQLGFFNDRGFESSIEYDDNLVGALPSGTFQLGVLRVSLASRGLNLASPFTVSIQGANSVIGVVDAAGDFRFESVAFESGTHQQAPATLSAPPTVLEGAPFELTVTPQLELRGTLHISWGDGSETEIPVQSLPPDGTLTHIYADGEQQFQVEVRLEGPHSGIIGELPIVVQNVPPRLELSGADRVDEGSSLSLVLGEVVDPGDDVVSHLEIDWGDGQRETVDLGQLGPSREVTHIYADGDAQFMIHVDAFDEDGEHRDLATHVVDVADVSPTIIVTGRAETRLGEAYVIGLGPVVDPGADTVSGYVIDWSDGTVETIAADSLPASRQLTHVYQDVGGPRRIEVQLVDEDAPHPVAGSFNVLVRDHPPSVTLSGPTSIREGDFYPLTISPLAGGSRDAVHEFAIDWGDGQRDRFPVEAADQFSRFEHRYLEGPADHLIRLQLLDVEGQPLNEFGIQLHVEDVLPSLEQLTISAAIPGDTLPGTPVTLNGHYLDPGAADVTVALVDWGDGTPPQAAQVTPNSEGGEITAVHQYVEGGVFSVGVELISGEAGAVRGETIAYVTGQRVDEGVLQIVGSGANDIITAAPQGDDGFFVDMTLPPLGNSRSYLTRTTIDRIEVYTAAGHDRVMISERLDFASYLDGGPGDDHLEGGAGPNVVVGGLGNDTLRGGLDRDILVGGGGQNRLFGLRGEDVLVGGRWDNSAAQHASARQTWGSPQPFQTRVLAIRELLEVEADSLGDTIFGGPDLDLLLTSAEDISGDTADGPGNSGDAEADVRIDLGVSDQQDRAQHEPSLSVRSASDGVGALPSLPPDGEGDPLAAYDTNGDGFLTPLDVVLIVNELNRSGPGTSSPARHRLDVTGDGFISPDDVLRLVNIINRRVAAAREFMGEEAANRRQMTAAMPSSAAPRAMAVIELWESEANWIWEQPHPSLA